jgi:hypothetical protein
MWTVRLQPKSPNVSLDRNELIKFDDVNRTNSVEQSPWEANSHSASQEIPFILWYAKVHYRVYKIPPPVPVLSQMNPAHTLAPYFPKIRKA